MNSRAGRLARGFIVGAFATAVAALLHVSAGGIAPSALALVLGVVFSGLLGTALTARRPSLPRLAISVGISQAAFHLGFSLLGTGATVTATGAAHAHALPAIGTERMPHAAHTDGPLMWLAHLAAGALTIAFLMFAERALWAALEAVARTIRSAFATPAARLALSLPAATTVWSERPRLDARVTTPLSRRGPPLPVGA